ncbi:MAG: 2-oxo acid dehydrogenase subunit E2 [Clostridiales bacterium]|nr:2-oxo acid dehydrogenase subunit E2 [Clostridiales bacterium]
MANPILMPKAGITVESCILTEWKVKVGDVVKAGDVLGSYETDKSSFDLTSEFDGEVLAIFCEAGDEVSVLTNIAVVGAKGEDYSSFAPNGAAAPAQEVKEAPVQAAAAPAAPAKKAPVNPNVKPVTMPKAGITVESCILTEWKVKVGDTVKVGDIMFSYETDKSSFDYQAEVEGEVLAIFCEAGDEVPVLSNVCAVGPHGEDASGLSPDGATESAAAVVEAPVATATATATEAPVATATANADGKVFASPRAKNLAVKLGVDLASATATGPNGRIIERDVRVASTNPKAVAPTQEVKAPAQEVKAAPVEVKASDDLKAYKDEKMSNIRKVIAKNMVMSLSTMAQLTHTISFDCTNVMAFRKMLKDNAEILKLPPITINNIIVYAVSRVLKKHRDLNAHLINGDTMRYFEHVNMGIATDTPRGLLVPTLFGADTMTLSEIAVKSKKLSQDAIDGKLAPEFLTGGSFTVSNVGTMGIESFTPVVNPPQTGILGVNTLETRIKLGKEGEIIPYTAMALSLSYDHRALDGAPASRFLKDLKDYLENFSVNLMADSI